MTLTQLSYVLAVAKHKHFGLAAESTFVTQPTLSMQIQKLEEELGIEIFDRAKQPIEPTAVGSLIIEQAQIAIAEAQKIPDLAVSTQQKVEGILTLGVIPTLAPTVLPLFIRDFIAKYPKLEVAIEEVRTQDIITRIREGSLDIGLLVTPLHEAGIVEHPIFQEPFVVYAADDHALYKSKKIDSKQLSADDVWLLNEGHCFREQVMNLCAARKKTTHGAGHLRFESGNLETLRKMVDQNGGYTLLPLLVSQDLHEPEQKKRIKLFDSPVPTREVSIVHHKLYPKRAVTTALIEEIRAHLPADVLKLKPGSIRRVGLR
jgi:LysR family transcriptional regulator, hydrogen peroxide-inducible genes activator